MVWIVRSIKVRIRFIDFERWVFEWSVLLGY